ncbi:MAG: methyltransferase [Planctomycetales bacterium 4484_123]|nr:MAG: methyltransferase [Planctomycetales bacterium 4484_123]
MADLQAIADALVQGDRDTVVDLAHKALDEGTPPGEILDKGLIAGMSVVGERFKNNEIYVPEVLIAARAMRAGMEVLEPQLKESGVESRGVAVLGTVKGDLHDIGKNLVAMMFQGGGLKVVDCGVDVAAEQFVQAATENNAQIVAMSALLTTTMPHMLDVIKAVKEAGLKVKTMIGGAPVTQAFADEIGADGYAPDAASAVDKALELLDKA